MAQYKVPQDVEADDKLLGPFSFRQFVYLMIAGALIALAVGLFQLFPLLAIIPLPPVLLFVALALPLKKDQPMETYLAAIVSYYLKPRTRVWKAGQRESTIQITAPKKVEPTRTRDITGEEATHRLSFLADIVDTEGYAIKGINTNSMREDLVAEASTVEDMFEGSRFDSLANTIEKGEIEHHAEVMKQMQETITTTEAAAAQPKKKQSAVVVMPEEEKELQVEPGATVAETKTIELKRARAVEEKAKAEAENRMQPQTAARFEEKVDLAAEATSEKPAEVVEKKAEAKNVEKTTTNQPKPSIIELANNDVLSVATIAKEAKRLKRKEEGEVFISLH